MDEMEDVTDSAFSSMGSLWCMYSAGIELKRNKKILQIQTSLFLQPRLSSCSRGYLWEQTRTSFMNRLPPLFGVSVQTFWSTEDRLGWRSRGRRSRWVRTRRGRSTWCGGRNSAVARIHLTVRNKWTRQTLGIWEGLRGLKTLVICQTNTDVLYRWLDHSFLNYKFKVTWQFWIWQQHSGG